MQIVDNTVCRDCFRQMLSTRKQNKHPATAKASKKTSISQKFVYLGFCKALCEPIVRTCGAALDGHENLKLVSSNT